MLREIHHAGLKQNATVLNALRKKLSSYVSGYAAKTEEYAEGTIRKGSNGQSFSSQEDGIRNKGFASVNFA